MDQDIWKNYGCVFPLRTNKPNESVCTLEKSHLSNWQNTILRNFHDWCFWPCETMTVTFAGFDSTADDGNENETYVKFYMKEQIQVKTSHFSYTKVSFLAEIGGYIGLLLGVSLMDLASLIDKMFALIHQKFTK